MDFFFLLVEVGVFFENKREIFLVLKGLNNIWQSPFVMRRGLQIPI